MAIATKVEIKKKFDALYIDPLAMKKVMYYAQAADGEVSGLGIIEKDAEGKYVVTEVFLLDQECTGADTEINPEAISKLMIDLMNVNKDPGKLKFWWHSHVNMAVFWSGTDDTACETLSREFAFSLVVNKSREMKCRLDIYNPMRITFDNVRVLELPTPEDSVVKDACFAEVKEKVKAPFQGFKKGQGYVAPFHGGTARDSYRDYNDYGAYIGGDDYSGYPAYRGYTPPDKRHGTFLRNAKEEKRITCSEVLAADIERLMDIAEKNQSDGGIFVPETWDEYIHQTLEEVVRMRLEGKAACKSPLTYDPTGYEDCTNGKCKVQRSCAYWTKNLNETEKDAEKELVDLMAHPENSSTNQEVVC